MACRPRNLAKRYLPPGKYSDMYQMYVSHQMASSEPCASSTTFYRVLNESGWRRVLIFRGKSQHSQRHVCAKLKSQLRHARGLQEMAAASDRLMRHLGGQFLDRSMYWALRNRARTDKDLLLLITDSMDKGKFALPRRPPKDIEDLKRPQCELTCTLAHGRLIYVAVTDEDQTTGSSWTVENVSRALEKAYALSQQHGTGWPSLLKIFADNTPKAHTVLFVQKSANIPLQSRPFTLHEQEVKNSVFARYCSSLVSSDAFEVVSHDHLTVGHTHEDIGAPAACQRLYWVVSLCFFSQAQACQMPSLAYYANLSVRATI